MDVPPFDEEGALGAAAGTDEEWSFRRASATSTALRQSSRARRVSPDTAATYKS